MSNVTDASNLGSGSRPPSDDGFDDLVASVLKKFDATANGAKPPALFTTDAANLFEVYLAALPAELRPINACATCRAFFSHYAGLVTIDERGKLASALWAAEPGDNPYTKAGAALAEAVRNAPITGVFVSSAPTYGVASKGGWSHLSITPSAARVFPVDRVRTAEQAVAELREDFRTLVAGLDAYPLAVVQRAASLLETGSLYRSEKCIAVAKWLLELHRARKSAKSTRARDNLTWRAVAAAPAGFCHVRSSIIATLLDDLVADLPFASLKARFDAKMDPLQYQRPTAPPSAGNIERAEKIVAKLRSAGALERRFAKLHDIEPLWNRTSAAKPDGSGVFGHLKRTAKPAAQHLDAPATVMTWEKFAKRVIPTAVDIHYLVPKANQSYMGLVTAVHPDAPPILQWDSEARRNPVSWYVYVKGSAPERWNLRGGVPHRVRAVTLSPAMWAGEDRHAHQGKFVLFVLEGAKDLEYQSGAGMFPEFMKAEYREIRSTLEAHTRVAIVAGKHEAEACGVALQQGVAWGQVFRVTDDRGVSRDYQLDRWD